MRELRIFTDGGARGNPGPAATGVYIESGSGEKIAEFGNYLGEATNNVAEYMAVFNAFSFLVENRNLLDTDTKIIFFMDSNLIRSQLTGVFKIKNANLKTLFYKIKEKEREIGLPVEYNFVPREKNKKADKMVNVTLDRNLLLP